MQRSYRTEESGEQASSQRDKHRVTEMRLEETEKQGDQKGCAAAPWLSTACVHLEEEDGNQDRCPEGKGIEKFQVANNYNYCYYKNYYRRQSIMKKM